MNRRAQRIREDVARVLRGRDEVIAAYMFGSVLESEEPADVDLALLLRPAEGGFVLQGVKEDVARQLDRQPSVRPLSTDVRLLNEAPLHFRYRVIKEGYGIDVGDPDARALFEARTMVEWFDFRPYWDAYNQAMVERIRKGR